MGDGYAAIIAARLQAEYPNGKLQVWNRGISGNTIYDLAARWEQDALALRPDMLSILIGINDTAAEIALDEFEAAYSEILERTRAALPNVRLVLCEPFHLAARGSDAGDAAFNANARARARVVEKLAKRYSMPFVRFQQAFDEAVKRAPVESWLPDGVHPTRAGHELMADEWLRTVTEFYR